MFFHFIAHKIDSKILFHTLSCFTFVTEPVLHTLSKYRSLKETRKHFCYMLKANAPCFYQRKYTCMRCKNCRGFKTDPFTSKVKCEREKKCGEWSKKASCEPLTAFQSFFGSKDSSLLKIEYLQTSGALWPALSFQVFLPYFRFRWKLVVKRGA